LKLLAIDQSSRVSGYAIFDNNKIVKYGKIELKDDDIGVRLNVLRNTLINLVQKYEIDTVAFEDIYMDGQRVNNVATFKVLAEVFGVCEELFISLNLPYTAVLAGTWKSTLGVKGKTRPEQKKSAQ
jgi:Holliday junction resolvasome RuvABC endonuclease subunit